MSENKKIYLTAIFSKISLILISVITSALINRQLGVALKGEYAYITNLVSMIVVILSFGLGQTYSTYRRKYGTDMLKYFVSLTLVQSVIAFIIAGIFLIAKNTTYAIVFALSSSGLLKSNFLYYAAIEDIRKRDINNVIYKIVYLVIITASYFLFAGSLKTLLLLIFLDDLFVVICTAIAYKFKLSFKGIKKIGIPEIYKLGFLCMVMHSLMTLNYNLDIIFLKKMSTSTMVGLYSVGVNLGSMLWLIPDAFKDILVNKTSRKDEIEEIVKVTKYSLYFSLIIIIGFVIFGKIFIKIMYGNEFLESYNCTVILFAGCLSMIIYKLIHPIYIAKGKQWVVVKILAVSVLTNVILNYMLIPKFNIYGASIASVFSYSVCSIIFLIIFCKEYNIQYKEFFVFKKGEIKKLARMFIKKN